MQNAHLGVYFNELLSIYNRFQLQYIFKGSFLKISIFFIFFSLQQHLDTNL